MASSDIQFPSSILHPNIWHINFLWMIHSNTHHCDPLWTLVSWSTCHSYILQLTHTFSTSTPSILHNIFLHTLGRRIVSFLTTVSLYSAVHKLLNRMYQFLVPSHQSPFVIFPEPCLPAEVFLGHTRFQPNTLFCEYWGWLKLLPQMAYNILYNLCQTIFLYAIPEGPDKMSSGS